MTPHLESPNWKRRVRASASFSHPLTHSFPLVSCVLCLLTVKVVPFDWAGTCRHLILYLCCVTDVFWGFKENVFVGWNSFIHLTCLHSTLRRSETQKVAFRRIKITTKTVSFSSRSNQNHFLTYVCNNPAHTGSIKGILRWFSTSCLSYMFWIQKTYFFFFFFW